MNAHHTVRSHTRHAKGVIDRIEGYSMSVRLYLVLQVWEPSSGRPSRYCRLALPGWRAGGGSSRVDDWGKFLLPACKGTCLENRREPRNLETDESLSAIRLDEHRAFGGGEAGMLSTIASVPYAALAGVQSVWAWVTRKVPFLDGLFMRSSRYRHLPLDDDGEFARRVAEVFPLAKRCAV